MDDLKQHIEALIFASEQIVTPKDIQACLSSILGLQLSISDIEKHIQFLIEKYQDPQYVFEIQALAGGYQFLSKPKYHHTVSALIATKAKKKLSTAALETLAIVAYKQPIARHEIEQIRGVNCDYAIQKLLEKELIVVSGRSESVGKPLLYSTSSLFMEHFGLRNLSELPKIKDFELIANEIGERENLQSEQDNNTSVEETENEKL